MFYAIGSYLFLKNDIRIRSKSCFGWNDAIRIWKEVTMDTPGLMHIK